MTTDVSRIELRESSGPVSPRYRYALRVLLTITGDTATLTWTRDGTAATNGERALTAEETRALLDELTTLGLEHIAGDFIGDKRANKGISLNRVELTRADGATSRCDYLLTSLEDPDFGPRPVIERLHALAASPT